MESLLKVGGKLKSAEGVYKPNPGPDGANLFIYHLPQVQISQKTFQVQPYYRSSPTQTSAKHSSHLAPSCPLRSLLTSTQTSLNASVSLSSSLMVFLPTILHRFCLLHNKRGGPLGHPGNERLPDWYQETQGPTQTPQGCWQALLVHTIWLASYKAEVYVTAICFLMLLFQIPDL